MEKPTNMQVIHIGGEVLRDAREKARVERRWHILGDARPPRAPGKKYSYIDELTRLQFELLKLQEWVRLEGLRVVVVFEGRDAAGKGGVIKRIAECLNPRSCRIVALPSPTERERGQWYFQRYVEQLPSRGEIVLFDRSWYNRAGVEHVMGFCTDAEYHEFLRACPLFEEMLVRSGIILIKYWFSVNDEEQERRFRERMKNPIKRWKLSPMDIESRERWVEYSRAKDVMLKHTDKKRTPGTSSMPTTRRRRGSTASPICCVRFPTRICGPFNSICRRASPTTATSARKSPNSAGSRRNTETLFASPLRVEAVHESSCGAFVGRAQKNSLCEFFGGG